MVACILLIVPFDAEGYANFKELDFLNEGRMVVLSVEGGGPFSRRSFQRLELVCLLLTFVI